LIETALTHRSAGSSNNERLEFLGDAILGFVIADEIYRQLGEADEGQLSRLRAGLVNRDSLADIARELDLGRYLNLGPGELRSGGQSRSSILADALEALFAAIYLDGGYPRAREFILHLFNDRLTELSQQSAGKDPKTRLQEYLQARKQELPSYEIEDVSGKQHDQIFTVRCTVVSLKAGALGRGGSRRKAEQAAADQILRSLREKNG
jgi:ribonuclease-3